MTLNTPPPKPKKQWAANPFQNTRPPAGTDQTAPVSQQQQPPRTNGGGGDDWREDGRNTQNRTIEEKLGQQPPRREAPYKLITDPNTGLARKIKLPGALDRPYKPSPSVTMEAAKRGAANWTDVFTDERERVLKDPEFYKNGITKFPQEIQQQILADPAFNFKYLPDWQKPFYEVSSDPRVMASPMALAGAHVGSSIPIIPKVAGAAIGAAAGYTLGLIGGQQFNPGGGYWDQPTPAAKAMWLLNEGAQRVEQSYGYGVTAATMLTQSKATREKNQKWLSDPKNREALWEASSTAYDYGLNGANLMPTFEGAWEELKNPMEAYRLTVEALKAREGMTAAEKIAEENRNPIMRQVMMQLDPKLTFAEGGQDFYIGASEAQQIGEGFNVGGLQGTNLAAKMIEEARWILDQEKKGVPIDEATTAVIMRGQATVGGQIGDFYGQARFDPLDIIPQAQTATGKAVSKLTGNKLATEAFSGTEGFREAGQKYKTLVQTSEGLKFDPTFDPTKMNSFERLIGGINEEGQVKAGSLKPTNRGLLAQGDGGLWEQTPQSRAETAGVMFSRNIGQIISTFTDFGDAVKLIKRIVGADDTVWAEMGSKVGQSPEWYTVKPALKDFDATTLEGMVQAREITLINRDIFARIAEILGQDPQKLLDDWAARGDAPRDFERIVQRLEQSKAPEAQALLADIDAGRLTPNTLKEIVEVFHGEGKVPLTDAEWKMQMYSELDNHFQEWVADHLQLDQTPEAKSAFFQTMGILKTAQSIMLLGLSPGYAITNGLSGMFHLAVDGGFGMENLASMQDYMSRWETPVPRLAEGVGIGGVVDQGGMGAIAKAGRGDGPLSRVKTLLGRVSRGMPMSKLSSSFEKSNGARGYINGIRKYMDASWRRGKGFRTMDPTLVKAISDLGVKPESIYAAIEAGMNQKDIERAIVGTYKGVRVHSLIDQAAKSTGHTPQEAADMLNKIGMTDTLNTYLEKAKTADQVDAAFNRADKQFRNWLAIRRGEEIKAHAEHVKNVVSKEGPVSALKVSLEAHAKFTDAWFEHYDIFGDIAEGIDAIPNPQKRAALFDQGYEQSTSNFDGVFTDMATTYNGIFEAWKISKDPDALNALAAISEQHTVMREAYETMRSLRRALTAKLIAEDRAPTGKELRAMNKTIDAAFDKAFTAKHFAEQRQGQALRNIYEKQHGKAAGEAARQWWEAVTQHTEMVAKDEQRFRKEINTMRQNGKTRAEIAIAKREYYNKNKVRMIADLERINQEGIARLETVVKNKDIVYKPGEQPAPKAEGAEPDRRDLATALENQILSEAQVHDAQVAAEAAGRVKGVWTIAANYWTKYAPFSPENFGDKNHLIATLSKPEYGGFPDLKGLQDPRLTPEVIKSIMDTRELMRASEAEKKAPESIKKLKKAKVKDPNNMTLLTAIASNGGLDAAKRIEYGHDEKAFGRMGLFRKKGFDSGWDISDMARFLADDGFPIDLNAPDDPGGVKQTQALIDLALTIDPKTNKPTQIFPVGHDFTANEAAINAAEAEHLAILAEDAAALSPDFNPEAWHAAMEKAINEQDLNTMAELMTEAAENNLGDQPHDAAGETYNEYLDRSWNDVDAQIKQQSAQEAAAIAKTDADTVTRQAEEHAQAVTKRTLLQEQAEKIWGKEKAQTWAEVTDAQARWYAKATGETEDAFYNRYYEGYEEGITGDAIDELQQAYTMRDITDREISQEEVNTLARMLARTDTSNIASAIRTAKGSLADRRAIMKAIYKIDPVKAVQVAVMEKNILNQEGNEFAVGESIENRTLSEEDAANYARMLERKSEREIGSAIREEANKADRITILKELYKLDPDKATNVARAERDYLMQVQENRIWYSKLIQTVENINQPRMTVDQLRGALVKGGVKADEIKWMGFNDFMEGKENVTKAEALEFLSQHQVEVEETVLGGISNQMDEQAITNATRDALANDPAWTNLTEELKKHGYEPYIPDQEVGAEGLHAGELFFMDMEFDDFYDEASMEAPAKAIAKRMSDTYREAYEVQFEQQATFGALAADPDWMRRSQNLNSLGFGYGFDPEVGSIYFYNMTRPNNWLDASDLEHHQAEIIARNMEEQFDQSLGNNPATQYKQYKLSGGENYREVLFHMPKEKPAESMMLGAKTYSALADDTAWNNMLTRMQDKHKYEVQYSEERGLHLVDMGGEIVPDNFRLPQRANDTWTMIKNAWDTEARIQSDKSRKATPYRSPHFADAGLEENLLAHTRLVDRTDVYGKKVLFIEEIQSDWHQKGREKGYQTPENEAKLKELAKERVKINRMASRGYETTPEQKAWSKLMTVFEQKYKQKNADGTEFIGGWKNKLTPAELKKYQAVEDAAYQVQAKYDARLEEIKAEMEKLQGGVPDAPFAKTWHEMVMKRVMRMAAEGNYDRIAWTTGDQQNARWSLAKHVRSIDWKKNADGTYDIRADDHSNRRVLGENNVTIDRIEEIAGKEVASRVLAGEGSELMITKANARDAGRTSVKWNSLTGDQLTVGGAGMKGFYDKMLPSFVNKYGKQWGVTSGETHITTDAQRIGEDFAASTLLTSEEGINIFYDEDSQAWFPVKEFDGPEDVQPMTEIGYKTAKEAAAAVNVTLQQVGERVHSIDVTDAMKDSVMGGQTLFQSSAPRPQPSPVWFSKLTRTVEALPHNKMTVDQLRGQLVKSGVKADEMKWMGLDAFLEGKKNVTKEETLNYLRGNEVVLGEVTKGGKIDPVSLTDEVFTTLENDKRYVKLNYELNKAGYDHDTQPDDPQTHIWMDKDGTEIGLLDIERKPRELAKQMRDIYDQTFNAAHDRAMRARQLEPTRYSGYKLPGGSNYREKLFTLPERTTLPEGYRVTQLRDGDWTLVQPDGTGLRLNEPGSTIEQATAEAMRRLKMQGRMQSADFQSGHWTEANVLAHTRLSDHIDADGKRVLVVEEIQSDWHQKGRDEGYKQVDIEQKIAEADGRENLAQGRNADAIERLGDAGITREYGARGNLLAFYRDGEQIATGDMNTGTVYENVDNAGSRSIELMKEATAAAKEYGDAMNTAFEIRKQRRGVPEAPFAKTWHEMVMKRVMRMAAEEGYERIAWTTGKQQAARYDLSAQIDELHTTRKADGSYKIDAGDAATGEPVREWDGLEANELAEYVGVDLAKKIINGEDKQTFTGLDLAVGGEGMAKFYDNDLPKFVDKYARQWGVKTGETLINGSAKTAVFKTEAEAYIFASQNNKYYVSPEPRNNAWSVRDSDTNQVVKQTQANAVIEPAESVFNMPGDETRQASLANKYVIRNLEQDGYYLQRDGTWAGTPRFFTDAEAKAAYDKTVVLNAGDRLHSIDITQAMRDSVLEGQPLFQDKPRQMGPDGPKGSVKFDGVKGLIRAYEAKDFSTLVHENAHIFRRVMADVAKRTGDPQIKADLATIEEWAGVKNGNWTVKAEEHFARGFEHYIRTGEAPTRRLKAAFRSMAKWMTEIYKTITGSAIDVKITPEVKAVFDRLLSVENERKLAIENLLAEGDQRQTAHKQLRNAWERLTIPERDEAIDWILNATMIDPLSGLETLVAQAMTTKPEGWIDATTDLNALKAINDNWGHMAGDKVIKELGLIVEEEVAKAGGRVFRVGGDEMSYWFPDVDSAKAALTEIDTRFKKKAFEVAGEERDGFTVSYGYGDTFEAADKMLYGDKERRTATGERIATPQQKERTKLPPSIRSLTRRQTDLAAHLDDIKANMGQLTIERPLDELAGLTPEDLGIKMPQDQGQPGGMLPGMQNATGMMIDQQPQPGAGITPMEAPNARSIYDVDLDATAMDRTGAELKPGDIVKDNKGDQHQVAGANMRNKIVTERGRIIDPKDVTKIAKQDTLLQPGTKAFENWFRKSQVVDKTGQPEVMYHSGTFDEAVDPTARVNDAGFHFGTEDAARERSLSRLDEGIFIFQEGNERWTWSNEKIGQNSLDIGEDYKTETQAYKAGRKAVDAYVESMQDADLADGSTLTEVYLSIQNPKRMADQQTSEKWNAAITQAKSEGYDGIVYKNNYEDKGNDSWIAFYPEQVKSVNNRGTYDDSANVLYQDADKPADPTRDKFNELGYQMPEAEQPYGAVDDAAGDAMMPHASAMDEGYRTQVTQLMDEMRKAAKEQVNNKQGGLTNMKPELADQLKKYQKQVQADLASTKNAATKWGEQQRDFSMLNYSKRYGADRWLDSVYPYQFFYTRSMMTWASRALNKPSIFSHYARIKRQTERYENNEPERMRGKIKIPMPWMPDWMGDSMYIDPARSLFTPMNFMRPFERLEQDSNAQINEAERILQEWAADGQASEEDIIQAAKTRSGTTWERAFAEAQTRRESEINNPMDFMNTMLGPAWYLTTPYKAMTGKKNEITSTPMLNSARAVDTVTQGTWAQPIGDLVGMLGKPEEMIRKKTGIPEFGEYGDYYVDRQLANMVADGAITSEEAQTAMIERKGEHFDQARERVKTELAMRVPGSAALMAGLTADNFAQGVARAATTSPASLFGSGLLPEGELKYRGLKSEWNEAWKRKDAGDNAAITKFFDNHPEYESYLAKGKKPEERLRSFLTGQIWDGYMALGTTDRKRISAEMGDEFKRSFLDSETRSYETIDIDTLAAWSQMLNRKVPDTEATAAAIAEPQAPVEKLDPTVTRITDKYFRDRTSLFPNYYEKQAAYYLIPKADKSARFKYLQKNPELKKYWDWNAAYKKKYPDLVDLFNGKAFKKIDTSSWPPSAVEYATLYAMTGEKLPPGAKKSLTYIWIKEGRPMDDFQSWLDSEVAPALLYNQ